jgi:hypothetical protein
LASFPRPLADPPRPRPRATLAAWLAAVLLALAACSSEAPLPGDPLRIASSSLPDPVLGESYRADVVAVGGLRPYSVRLEEGALPPGLSLQGGRLVGTPTELGRFSFTLSVSDANLASTFESFDVTVRDVPRPRLSLPLPETEVRGTTTLRGRVEEARDLRAMRLRLSWQGAPLNLPDDAVRASRQDVALFWQAQEDGVSIDLAFLGEAFDGGGELFRLDVEAAEALRLGMDLQAELLYADRHAFESRRLGVARSQGQEEDAAADDPQDDEASDENDGPGDGDDDVDPDDGDPSGENVDDATSDDAGEETP